MARKVWIEVALNGAWGRDLQPGIPATVETIVAEGIACAKAGAAIIHTHAYTNGSSQTFDWQVYARIIEGIRTAVDVPVYPSYPAVPEGDWPGCRSTLCPSRRPGGAWSARLCGNRSG